MERKYVLAADLLTRPADLRNAAEWEDALELSNATKRDARRLQRAIDAHLAGERILLPHKIA